MRMEKSEHTSGSFQENDIFIPELEDSHKRHELRNSIWQNLERHALASKQRQRRIRLYSYSAAAALVAVLCSVSFYFLSADPSAGYQYYQTRAGEQKSVTLADGSVLQLNADTRVGIATDGWKKRRKVFLDHGEVFFKVARNPQVPFVATTKMLSIKVLGTSFNIRAYRNEKEEVRVKTGKVMVASRQSESGRIITPGYMVSMISEKARLNVQKVVAAESDSWTSGVYHYLDQPLSKILADLERVHRVKFEVSKRVELTRNYTVQLDKITLQEAIGKLELMGEMQMSRKADTIYVKASAD